MGAAYVLREGLLDATGSDHERCEVWDLEEPVAPEPLKACDRLRFNRGMPPQGASW